MKKLLYILVFIICIPSVAIGGNYYYYFSDDATGNAAGNDSTGDGSIGNPWKSLSKAQSALQARSSGDHVYLYFDKSDTWTVNTESNTLSILGIDNGSGGQIMHIDAYGTGAKPIFNGSATFATTSDCVGDGGDEDGPCYYTPFIRFRTDGGSISNVHLQNIYGLGIALGTVTDPADSITIEENEIENMGMAGVQASLNYGSRNSVFTKNIVHGWGILWHNGKDSGHNAWSYAVSFSPVCGASRAAKDNEMSYNVIHSGYGEGIHGNGKTAEYNIIYDTGSVGIYNNPFSQDAQNDIIRYNLVASSANNPYTGGGVSDDGIEVASENSGCAGTSDLSGATASIYGNIVINRKNGIVFRDFDGGNAWGGVRINNNTVIDSRVKNYQISNVDYVAAGQGFFYNNLSALYGRTGNYQTGISADPTGYWTFSNNAFWDETSGDEGTVNAYFRPGSEGTDWQSANPNLTTESGYTSGASGDPSGVFDVDDVAYAAGSSLIAGNGKNISALGWDDYLLNFSARFNGLPDTDNLTAYVKQVPGGWPIGAIQQAFGITPTITGSNIFDSCLDDSSPYNDTQTVTFNISSTATANCNFEVKATSSPCSGETYSTLTDAGGYGGGAMADNPDTAFAEDVTMNCDTTRHVAVICRDTTNSEDSNCLELTLAVSAGGGEPPQPPTGGINIDTGGMVNIVPCPAGETCININ